jgi:hypothetical protein
MHSQSFVVSLKMAFALHPHLLSTTSSEESNNSMVGQVVQPDASDLM